MLTTLDNKCDSNVERQCHETKDPSSEKKLNLFLRSQKQLWPTRKTNLFHAMQTVNASRITLNSRKKIPPSLLVSYNEAGTMKTFIVADSIHVRCNNDATCRLLLCLAIAIPKGLPYFGFFTSSSLEG
ncbi:uncharacterized protein LOC143466093 [Clavelina lepadiformis]|uniref:uncharacterized protein LOC143466093 n=1 Tax=Clavelina lepadiformis TaxID=159417 RepID=UPI004041D132